MHYFAQIGLQRLFLHYSFSIDFIRHKFCNSVFMKCSWHQTNSVLKKCWQFYEDALKFHLKGGLLSSCILMIFIKVCFITTIISCISAISGTYCTSCIAFSGFEFNSIECFFVFSCIFVAYSDFGLIFYLLICFSGIFLYLQRYATKYASFIEN